MSIILQRDHRSQTTIGVIFCFLRDPGVADDGGVTGGPTVNRGDV
jgi:hypothetical protein